MAAEPGTADAIEAHAELVALLGYVGGTRITLSITPCACNPCNCSPCRCDACKCGCCAPPELTAKDLTRHPRVLAVLAKHNGCESRLDAEIRRQYPELKVGPAYEREEGIDRLGIVAGLTLPLWNRNRKGIAEATGERHAARCEVINEWRSLVREYRKARDVAAVSKGLDLVLAREELRRFASVEKEE